MSNFDPTKLKDITNLFEEQRSFLTNSRDDENSWKQVRSKENFKESTLKFPWGERKIYEPIEVKNNYLLQRSRGIDLEIEDSDEKMREKIKNSIENLVEIDHIRINEIDKVANLTL